MSVVHTPAMDGDVEEVARRHYASHPGRIPHHWSGPRDVRVLLDALGIEPICHCADLGAPMIDAPSLGAPLVQHLPDCAWLQWTLATGGCQGDE